jgi:hypothetical protein
VATIVPTSGKAVMSFLRRVEPSVNAGASSGLRQAGDQEWSPRGAGRPVWVPLACPHDRHRLRFSGMRKKAPSVPVRHPGRSEAESRDP